MFTDEEIEKFRNDTPGCTKNIHFNNAGAGLMPTPVVTAIKNHIDLEAQIGGYEAHHFRSDSIKGAYAEAAKFIKCSADNIAYTSNATDSFARALSSIPLEKGDVILTSEDDYISNQIMYLSLQKRFGVKLIRVPSLIEGGIDPEETRRLIKQHQPKLVAVTHIPTNSGLIQDVVAIGEICRQLDTLYLVDACQSAGQLPLDLTELRCDFLSATMRKYLRGPRGAGFLYVSDSALKKGLEPLFIDMQGAIWSEANEYTPVNNATRFEDWEFAYALIEGSREAFKYANQIGIGRISAKAIELAAKLRTQLTENRIETLDHGANLGALVTVNLNDVKLDHLEEHLTGNHINYSISRRDFATIDFDRKKVDWALRLSPHYYNTIDEVDQVAAALRALRK